MNYVIENDKLKATFSSLGAEMQSLIGKKTGREYLWQGDPEFWKNRATLLFPICGRLEDGKYTYNGKEYEMNLHGFARASEFEVEQISATQIAFSLTANEQTKKTYPFDFKFTVLYTLIDNAVRTQFIVENDGEDELPFSVGGHPGFNVPFNDGEQFEDYYIEFNEQKKVNYMVMSPKYLNSGKKAPLALEDDKILRLRHDLFDNDAIFVYEPSNVVSLKSVKNDKKIVVTCDNMKYVGFWHTVKKPAPFVCIEPWHGCPATDGIVDDFKTKELMIHIKKGQTFTNYFDIAICE